MDDKFHKLDIDLDNIKNHEDYKNTWEKIAPLELKMVEKNERCEHNLGDKIIYKNPYEKPKNVCYALLHVIDLYFWRASFGYPSWNVENRRVFKLHCPDPKGTVWEVRRLSEDEVK